MINRKIAISAVSILSAVTMLGSSAFAVFSSTNTNQSNSFGTGTLILQINRTAPTSTGVINVSGKMPGDVVSGALNLHNSGTVPAGSVSVTGIALSGDTPLANDLSLRFFRDDNANGIFDGTDAYLTGSAHLSDGVWTGLTLPTVSISAASSYHLGAEITFDSGAPNSDQGKTVNFDIGFQANQ